MAHSTEPAEPRLLQPSMRLLMVVAAVLVALAGVQLFVFSTRTERFFAWTIDPPLTAAFLGAAYWASVALEVSASRRRLWADARIATPTVFLFTVLTLVVTLVHIDRFHLGPEFELGTRAVTWAWIAVYSVVPILLVIVTVRQFRTPGTDPPPSAPLPRSLGVAVGALGVALAGFGLWLLVDPVSAAELWPWTLTPLTGRAIGAWLLSMGVAAFHALREGDLLRVRPAAYAFVAFGLLQGVVLARFPGEMAWDSAPAIGYVLFLGVTLVVGLYALAAGRRR